MKKLSQTWRQKHKTSNTGVGTKDSSSFVNNIGEKRSRRSERLAKLNPILIESSQCSLLNSSFGFEFDADALSIVDKIEQEHGQRILSTPVPGLSPITLASRGRPSSSPIFDNLHVKVLRSTPVSIKENVPTGSGDIKEHVGQQGTHMGGEVHKGTSDPKSDGGKLIVSKVYTSNSDIGKGGTHKDNRVHKGTISNGNVGQEGTSRVNTVHKGTACMDHQLSNGGLQSTHVDNKGHKGTISNGGIWQEGISVVNTIYKSASNGGQQSMHVDNKEHKGTNGVNHHPSDGGHQSMHVDNKVHKGTRLMDNGGQQSTHVDHKVHEGTRLMNNGAQQSTRVDNKVHKGTRLMNNGGQQSTHVDHKSPSNDATSDTHPVNGGQSNADINILCDGGMRSEIPSGKVLEEKCLLSSWGLPDSIYQQYEKMGMTRMFDWQVECLCTGNVLNGGNLVYSAPTSAGKTMVAELLMIKRVLETKCKALFILPFVSVTREKMFYLQRMFQEADIKVDGYMGSQAPSQGFNAIDIAVCTIEKANGLVNRLMEDGQLHTVGAIVVDEMHMIGDPSRGYLLELLLTKVLYMQQRSLDNVSQIFNLLEAGDARDGNVQIIGMSATLPNVDVLAKWLRADLYFTNFRPVPLTETFKVGPVIYDNHGNKLRELSPSRMVSGDSDHVLLLCQETVEHGHAVLMFCPTKAWCEKLAENVARHFHALTSGAASKNVTSSVRLNYDELRVVFEQLRSCHVGLDNVLGKTLRYGVAYHHAGLTFEERDVIESAFRQGVVKVLIATSTLSSGVNLPARRVIIRTPMFHGKLMSGLVYKQMSGRAGRKGVDSRGESILICNTNEKQKVSTLLQADLKPVESCLVVKRSDEDEGNGIKRALLEVIASGVACTPDDVHRYASCTFYVSSKTEEDGRNTEDIIKSTVEYLVKNEFITLRKQEGVQDEKTSENSEYFVSTQLGQATLASSLSPDEALVVFAELRKARKCFVLENELHIIYQVTPIYLKDQWPNLDWYQYLGMWEHLPSHMKRVAELIGVEERFLNRAVRGRVPMHTEAQVRLVAIHKRFYVAMALHELVQETPLDVVARRFGANRGMLQSLQSSAATFAGMVTVFCHKLGWVNLEMLLSQFQNRLTFGVERELCDLVRISSLNGFRARLLYNAGYHTVMGLASASSVEIEKHLRKATPFESTKRSEWESERDLQRRMHAKCVWVDGRKGLTEAEAAKQILVEAREIMKQDALRLGIEWKPAASQKSRNVPGIPKNGTRGGRHDGGDDGTVSGGTGDDCSGGNGTHSDGKHVGGTHSGGRRGDDRYGNDGATHSDRMCNDGARGGGVSVPGTRCGDNGTSNDVTHGKSASGGVAGHGGNGALRGRTTASTNGRGDDGIHGGNGALRGRTTASTNGRGDDGIHGGNGALRGRTTASTNGSGDDGTHGGNGALRGRTTASTNGRGDDGTHGGNGRLGNGIGGNGGHGTNSGSGNSTLGAVHDVTHSGDGADGGGADGGSDTHSSGTHDVATGGHDTGDINSDGTHGNATHGGDGARGNTVLSGNLVASNEPVDDDIVMVVENQSCNEAELLKRKHSPMKTVVAGCSNAKKSMLDHVSSTIVPLQDQDGCGELMVTPGPRCISQTSRGEPRCTSNNVRSKGTTTSDGEGCSRDLKSPDLICSSPPRATASGVIECSSVRKKSTRPTKNKDLSSKAASAGRMTITRRQTDTENTQKGEIEVRCERAAHEAQSNKEFCTKTVASGKDDGDVKTYDEEDPNDSEFCAIKAQLRTSNLKNIHAKSKAGKPVTQNIRSTKTDSVGVSGTQRTSHSKELSDKEFQPNNGSLAEHSVDDAAAVRRSHSMKLKISAKEFSLNEETNQAEAGPNSKQTTSVKEFPPKKEKIHQTGRSMGNVGTPNSMKPGTSAKEFPPKKEIHQVDAEHSKDDVMTVRTPSSKQARAAIVLNESPDLIADSQLENHHALSSAEMIVIGEADKVTPPGKGDLRPCRLAISPVIQLSPELYSEGFFADHELSVQSDVDTHDEGEVAKLSESRGFDVMDTSLELYSEELNDNQLPQSKEDNYKTHNSEKRRELMTTPVNNCGNQNHDVIENIADICTPGMFESEMCYTQSSVNAQHDVIVTTTNVTSPNDSDVIVTTTNVASHRDNDINITTTSPQGNDVRASDDSRLSSTTSFSLKLSQSFEVTSDSDLSSRTLAAVAALEEQERSRLDESQGFLVESDISIDAVAAIEALETEIEREYCTSKNHDATKSAITSNQTGVTAIEVSREAKLERNYVNSKNNDSAKPPFTAIKSKHADRTSIETSNFPAINISEKPRTSAKESIQSARGSNKDIEQPAVNVFKIVDVTKSKEEFHKFLEGAKSKSFSFSVAVDRLVNHQPCSRIGQNYNNNDNNKGTAAISKHFPLTIDELGVVLMGVALCLNEHVVYYVSLENWRKETDESVRSERPTLMERITSLRDIFGSSREHQVKTTFDAKEQYKVLSQSCGILLQGQLQDPKVGAWLLDPGAKERNFRQVIEHFLPQENILLQGISGSSCRARSCVEVALIRKLMEHLKPLLEAEGLFHAFTEIEMPVMSCLARMELNGFGFSNDECERIKHVLQAKLRRLEQAAYHEARQVFSLSSPEDVSRVLFLDLKLPPDGGSTPGKSVRPTRGGRAKKVKYFSTSKDVLEKLLSIHPLPGVILEWRRINSALTKIVYPVQKQQVHCGPPLNMSRVYSLAVTHSATGRVTFVEPNLQMVPKDFNINLPTVISDTPPEQPAQLAAGRKGRGKYAKRGVFVPQNDVIESSPGPEFAVSMRSAFVPRQGGVLLAADYSQLELRLIAHLSRDQKLASFLNGGGDVFKTIASEVFRTRAEDITNDQRQRAKQVCYGIIYGIGAKALGQQLGVDEDEAACFVNAFKARFAGVRAYLKTTVENCRKLGYVTTVSGRKRHLPSIRASNACARAHAERQAVNTTVQGSAADLVKRAMANIDQRLCVEFPCCAGTYRQRAEVTESEIPENDEPIVLHGSGQVLFRGAYLVLQLHDELVFEVGERDLGRVMEIVKHEMENAFNLTVKTPVKMKAGNSWGTMEPLDS